MKDMTDKAREETLCPDCEGTGIVVGVRIEPRCCGNLNEYGGCCNYPVPDQVAEPEQCERCQATGILSSKPKLTGSAGQNNEV